MRKSRLPLPALNRLMRALIVLTITATVVVAVPIGSPTVDAQPGTSTLEVWGISGGAYPNPKTWKFRQSTSAADNLGSATAADPNLNDSTWQTRELRWRDFPGANVATHFRKDFNLADVGVTLAQIEAIRVSLEYDDAAVMYLNGVEVYRTIRGNLDPDYSPYGLGTNIPYNVNVPWGGFENYYVDIPNVNGTNDCEEPTGCTASPYGGPNPPAIPVSLLRNGVNTWGVTVWNNSGGGSGDSSMNHVFELVINDEPPNPVFINEVMATNSVSWQPPGLTSPDWFELINTSTSPVNLAGWTISDDLAAWVFPSVTIPAGGYLLVAANDGNRTDTTPLQTNFKLAKEGDTLKLTNPQGRVADEYPVLPPQFTDNSYGRPGNTGSFAYLAAATPGGPNSGAGNGYDPILRLFPNRLYNRGETVSHQIDAFDPDGDPLTYTMTSPPPGVTMSPTGLISGVVTTVGSFTSTLRVTDGDNDFASQTVQWVVLPPPTGPSPIVLNEYNAVAPDRELSGGSVLGNGGDWFEFVVVQDELDLRGYILEFYDQKGPSGQLRLAARMTVANDRRLARVPAGTIITVSQTLPDDLSFNGTNDWHINLNLLNDGVGTFFAPPTVGTIFNSTRDGQTVVIKNPAGVIVTPLAGESDAWDAAGGGVSGAEVMSYCVTPAAGATVNPITGYRDQGLSTTFGSPNRCFYPNPADLTQTITFDQSLATLRSTASLGAGSGDPNCDLVVDVVDALLIAQFSVGSRVDAGPCLFAQGVGSNQLDADAGDINRDSTTNVVDALIVARCSVGIVSEWCP